MILTEYSTKTNVSELLWNLNTNAVLDLDVLEKGKKINNTLKEIAATAAAAYLLHTFGNNIQIKQKWNNMSKPQRAGLESARTTQQNPQSLALFAIVTTTIVIGRRFYLFIIHTLFSVRCCYCIYKYIYIVSLKLIYFFSLSKYGLSYSSIF